MCLILGRTLVVAADIFNQGFVLIIANHLQHTRMVKMKSPDTGALTVKEFLDWSRISRTTFYAQVNAGKIPLRKVGKRSLVARVDAENWLNSLPTAA